MSSPQTWGTSSGGLEAALPGGAVHRQKDRRIGMRRQWCSARFKS